MSMDKTQTYKKELKTLNTEKETLQMFNHGNEDLVKDSRNDLIFKQNRKNRNKTAFEMRSNS